MDAKLEELKQALIREKSIEKKGQIAIEIAWFALQCNEFTSQDADWFNKL